MIKNSSLPNSTILRGAKNSIWSFILNLIDTRSWLLLAAGLTALSLLPIWLVTFPPLEDYPYHLLKAHIIANYSNPAFNYDQIFNLSFFPVPYIMIDYLLLPLAWLFPIQMAGKIVISLYTILLPWSCFYFIRSVDKRKTILGFFSYLFIYNWFFNKGFLSFVFSLPFFLLAVGYWQRTKDRPTWKSQLLLAAIILCVYLSHIFSFVVLCCILGLLALLSSRKIKGLLYTVIPFLPAVMPFVGAFIHQMSQQIASGEPVVFLYRTLGDKLVDIKRYAVSYSLAQDGVVIFLAAVLALALLIYGFRSLKQNVFLAVWGMLALIYLVLPSDITRYLFFACRILTYLAFMALPLLTLPKKALLRRVILLILITLAVFHFTFTLSDYQLANRELQDYYAAIQQIPSKQMVLFQTDEELAQASRINYQHYFGGYYYIEKGSEHLPSLEEGGFIGPFRSVQLKNNRPLDQSSQIKKGAAPIAKRVDQGGYAIFLSQGETDEVKQLANEQGYSFVLAIGEIVIYRRESVPPKTHSKTDQVDINYSSDHDYLALYDDLDEVMPLVNQDFERVFSQGYAHLFKRRAVSSQDAIDQNILP